MNSTTNTAIERMRTLSPLCGSSDKDLAFVDRHTYEFTVPAGTIVISEGDDPQGFFLITSGRVEVSVAGTPCGELGPGGFFGEISMFDLGAEPATVTSLTASGLRVASRREFRELIDVPRIARAIMLTLAARERVALGFRQFVMDRANDDPSTSNSTSSTVV